MAGAAHTYAEVAGSRRVAARSGPGPAGGPLHPTGPARAQTRQVLMLQRAIGNRAVARLLESRQGAELQELAFAGTSGASGPLLHLDAIQKSFGRHDVSHVRAHTDSKAVEGTRALSAEAFAFGEHVAFTARPSLRTAAHEAAHVIQQRGGVRLAGGVGRVGDDYEQHAEAVAERVVRGQSSEALLDAHAPPPPLSVGSAETGPRPAPASVQRIVLTNLGGADDEATYQQRIPNLDFGSGLRNLGWIKIGVPLGNNNPLLQPDAHRIHIIHGASQYGQVHTEETLIAQALALGVDLTAAPDDVNALRVVELYTERKPCEPANADAPRLGRLATDGNCDAYVRRVLHARTPVSYSVPNDLQGHTGLMLRQDVRRRKELAKVAIGHTLITKVTEARAAYQGQHQNRAPPNNAYHPWVQGLWAIRDLAFQTIGGVQANDPARYQQYRDTLSAAQNTAAQQIQQYPSIVSHAVGQAQAAAQTAIGQALLARISTERTAYQQLQHQVPSSNLYEPWVEGLRASAQPGRLAIQGVQVVNGTTLDQLLATIAGAQQAALQALQQYQAMA